MTETSAPRFEVPSGGTYVVEKSGFHHFGCGGAGMHHEDDCPRGFRTELGMALEGGPVPIAFVAGPAFDAVVRDNGATNWSSPRLFRLQRDRDPAGMPGPGHVADGVQFADGTVVIHWTVGQRETRVWDSLDAAMWRHGYDGATKVVFADVLEDNKAATGPARSGDV